MSFGGGRQNEFVNNAMVACDHTVELDARGIDPDRPHCRRSSDGGSGVLFDRLEAVPYHGGSLGVQVSMAGVRAHERLVLAE